MVLAKQNQNQKQTNRHIYSFLNDSPKNKKGAHTHTHTRTQGYEITYICARSLSIALWEKNQSPVDRSGTGLWVSRDNILRTIKYFIPQGYTD